MCIMALYLACLCKKSVRLIGMSCTSWLCILPVCAKKCQTYVHHGSVSCLFVHTHTKSVRLIGMSCATWLCILPVCAKKLSDLLECHVHHGSVSCLSVQKKCQTYWNVMCIMALYLACLCKKSVRLIGMSCTSWLCILPVSAKKEEKKSDFFLECHAIIALYLACLGKQGVRLIGMSCTSWLCILPVCAKKVSDLLECHVHHGSVSCLFGERKNVTYIMAWLNW